MPGRKTAVDFARFLRLVSDGPYRDAERIVLVCDSLNTPAPACLYDVFEPAEAQRLGTSATQANRSKNVVYRLT